MQIHRYAHSAGTRTQGFRDLKDLMAKATPLRAGDQLAGVAAESAEQRVVTQMALGDDIGERPGLSSPDSMGLYRTWLPRVGRTDARRIWISNVRPAGLGHDAAAFKLSHLLNQARQRQLSGVDLKDDTEAVAPATIEERSHFLLG